MPISPLRSMPRACIVASLNTIRRSGEKGRPSGGCVGRVLVSVDVGSLELCQQVKNLWVEFGPEPLGLDAELQQELCGPALRLGGQRGQQVERLDSG